MKSELSHFVGVADDIFFCPGLYVGPDVDLGKRVNRACYRARRSSITTDCLYVPCSSRWDRTLEFLLFLRGQNEPPVHTSAAKGQPRPGPTTDATGGRADEFERAFGIHRPMPFHQPGARCLVGGLLHLRFDIAETETPCSGSRRIPWGSALSSAPTSVRATQTFSPFVMVGDVARSGVVGSPWWMWP